MCPGQFFGGRHHKPVADIHTGSECTEPFHVEIDRAASDITSTRKRNFRPFIFAQKRSDQIIGRPDFADIFIIYIEVPDK